MGQVEDSARGAPVELSDISPEMGSPDDLFKIVRQQVRMPSGFPDMGSSGELEPEVLMICRPTLNADGIYEGKFGVRRRRWK